MKQSKGDLRWNNCEIDLISSSQLSTIKHVGCHSGFHLLTIPKASLIATVVSSWIQNDATIW